MLCCPEDVACTRSGMAEHSRTEWSEECVAPICRECAKHLEVEARSLTPASLSNDMMMCYVPTIMYAENVTVMEMICASACVAPMICFTQEKKYRSCSNMGEEALTDTYRTAARGSTTSFLLLVEGSVSATAQQRTFCCHGYGCFSSKSSNRVD